MDISFRIDTPIVHPIEVGAAILKGIARSQDDRFHAAVKKNDDTRLVSGFVAHKDRDIQLAISIEVTALEKGIEV
jgi:hypothetical protein